jgi:two-component system response regulator (stage 0 sporulation protein F)
MNENTTLLYVDDEPINLKLFTINFKNKFRVITTESGIDGLAKLNLYPEIAIVISDMKMPGMNGVEFIEAAKKDFPDVTYFILTGFDITEEIAEAMKKGIINKYFRKPFNMKEVEESIIEAQK